MNAGRSGSALLVAAFLTVPLAAGADESFDVTAYDKKSFEATGFIEFRPERQWLRRDSTGYLLQFPGESRATLDRRTEAVEVSGVLRRESLSFRFTGHAGWTDADRGSSSDARMYEAFGGWQASERTNFELGKRALRWGKGYAWSPVAFLERAKDPTDPELSREGFVMATGAWVRSFDGPVRTVAVNTVLVPTTSGLNADYGAAGHLNPAVKLYGLVFDTDVDLIWAGRGSRGSRFGVDFSRNLGSNLEIHGEWARVPHASRVVLTPAGTLVPQAHNADGALIGLRYLTQRDTTVIFELYRQGGGYTTDEMTQFHDLVRASGVDTSLRTLAVRAAAQGYAQPTPAQRYAYLRVTQKEPFDILDFTPAATLIANTGDRSWSLIPELLYTGFKDLELRLRLTLNHGGRSTDYGEKPARSRVELRARYFF